MLKPEIATKWVAALRSGDFPQGREKLRAGNTYCCLGVLCTVYQQETGRGSWTVRDEFLSNEGWGEGDYGETEPPEVVKAWAGLDGADIDTLTDLNDGDEAANAGSVDFETIATFIETFL